jgi:hypothetical protein
MGWKLCLCLRCVVTKVAFQVRRKTHLGTLSSALFGAKMPSPSNTGVSAMKSITMNRVLGCIGIVACLATFDIANWIKAIASVLPQPLLFALFVVLAAGVWLARERVKLMYAFWEVFVGLFALGVAAQRAPITDSSDPMQRNLFFISLVGGIFLIVRGIDNVRQAYPDAACTLKKWGRHATSRPR